MGLEALSNGGPISTPAKKTVEENETIARGSEGFDGQRSSTTRRGDHLEILSLCRDPEDFFLITQNIGCSGEDEKQVRESIEIGHGKRVEFLVEVDGPRQPFRSSYDSSCAVEVSTSAGSPWKDKGGQSREVLTPRIAPPFEPVDPLFRNPESGFMPERGGEVCPHIEEIVLNMAEHWHHRGRDLWIADGKPEKAVRFIDTSIGIKERI
jgi:hypothetical protein